MPRAKRYFPVSQEINTDPQIRRLKRDCGITGFSIWLEILGRTDGRQGLWKGNEKDIKSVLAGVCETNTRGSSRVLQYLTDLGWITWQRGSEQGNREGLIVVNYREFHKHEEQKSSPSEPPLPNLPKKGAPEKRGAVDNSVDKSESGRGNSGASFLKDKSSELSESIKQLRATAAKSAMLATQVSDGLNRIAAKVYNRDPIRFHKLGNFIEAAKRKKYTDDQIADALTEFDNYDAKQMISGWYGYLERILDRRAAKANAAENERQNNESKKAPIHFDLVRLMAELKGV